MTNLVLSGTFNPFHEGHQKLLETAIEKSKKMSDPINPFYEMSTVHCDKTDTGDFFKKVEQFSNSYPLIVTPFARFVEKAILLPNTIFVMGFDTAQRLLDDTMEQDIDFFKRCNIRFWVAPRNGLGLQDLWPLEHQGDWVWNDSWWEALPYIGVDTSSTEIRNGNT